MKAILILDRALKALTEGDSKKLNSARADLFEEKETLSSIIKELASIKESTEIQDRTAVLIKENQRLKENIEELHQIDISMQRRVHSAEMETRQFKMENIRLLTRTARFEAVQDELQSLRVRASKLAKKLRDRSSPASSLRDTPSQDPP